MNVDTMESEKPTAQSTNATGRIRGNGSVIHAHGWMNGMRRWDVRKADGKRTENTENAIL